MPVGAIIGGVASIGGALLSSSSQSKAAGKAADAQAQAAAEAAKVQKEIYQQNVGYQTPLLNTGYAAMNQMNALLGLAPQAGAVTTGGANSGTEPTPPSPGTGFGSLRPIGLIRQIKNGETLDPALLEHYGLTDYNNQYQAWRNSATTPTTTPAVNPQEAANAAYEQFKNYTGYQTRLTEANNAMNSAYAAKGTLQSGAALQAMAKMNQDYASNEFGNYFGYLGGQQQLAAGAANALSGVGTNYANAASNIAMQQGNNAANAAIAQGNIKSNMWNGIASGIGGIAGSVFGGGMSSYSDRRLKRDIEKIGEYSNGLGKYRWVYRFDPDNTIYEGVMADEVKALVPDAYSEDARGYGMVNYAMLGVAA